MGMKFSEKKTAEGWRAGYVIAGYEL